jgi:hypothetical protein
VVAAGRGINHYLMFIPTVEPAVLELLLLDTLTLLPTQYQLLGRCQILAGINITNLPEAVQLLGNLKWLILQNLIKTML